MSDPWATARASDWLLWQLIDSAFPTGGYAHSAGLESAWQHRAIPTPAALRQYAEVNLEQFGRSTLPFVRAAHEEPEQLVEFDDLTHACTSNHVANRASRLQGRAFRNAVTRLFDQPTGPCSLTAAEAAPARGFPSHLLDRPWLAQSRFGHFAPLFGATTRSLGLPALMALRAFSFLHIRTLFSAAVRLNIVGPLEAQSLQLALSRTGERVAQSALTRTLEDVAQTAPMLELWQGRHDQLGSRLFQS